MSYMIYIQISLVQLIHFTYYTIVCIFLGNKPSFHKSNGRTGMHQFLIQSVYLQEVDISNPDMLRYKEAL